MPALYWEDTYRNVGVFLCLKIGGVSLLIVKIQGVHDSETHEVIRRKIKEQMNEGIIVHDDTIELTFAPRTKIETRCSACGSTNYELINTETIEGELISVVLKCDSCINIEEIHNV